MSLLTVVGSVGLVLMPAAMPSASAADAASGAAAGATGGSTSAAGANSGATCSGGICSQTFTSTGSWSQPTATGDVRIVAAGGRGGHSGDGTEGGQGRALTIDSPSHSFSFSIGGEGADGDGTSGGAGGAYGGGRGGDAADGADGGGGGGATFLVDESAKKQILVAAGGGGGGGGFQNGDKANGYQPRFFGDGGDAGLNGPGQTGGFGQFQFNAGCDDAIDARGGTGSSSSFGGAGGVGGRGPTDTNDRIPGYGGGSGGGGGGGAGPGRGGCGSQSAAGNGADGAPGQGGAGGGNGNQGNCISFGCTVSQSKNGGGGGGGGIFGGGGGGAARGLAAGGGGGGASRLTEGVKDAGLNDGAGYVTIQWRYPVPKLTIVGGSSLTSTGPGSNVSIQVDVTGRQAGSGSAGQVWIVDEYAESTSVRACARSADGTGRGVPNGSGIVYCAVDPTVDTTYTVYYRPSARYVPDPSGSLQSARVTVDVGTETSTTTMATPGTVVVGQGVPLRATVTALRQKPTGTVTFEYHDTATNGWSYAGASDTVVRSDGRTGDASTTSFPLPRTADQLRATYAGNNSVQGSRTQPLQLTTVDSLLSLRVSSTDLTYGDRLTVTATAPDCTSGRVSFYDADTTGATNGTLLGTADIGSDHRAQLSLTPSVGSLVLSARGDRPCAGSDRNLSTPWQLVTTAASPTTTSADVAVRGDVADVTVQVATPSRTSIPSGEVVVRWRTTFGGRASARGNLSGGSFTTTATDLLVGASQITMDYLPTGTRGYSQSSTTALVDVDQRPTTVGLSATPAKAPLGGLIPVTATVTASGRAVPFGSVRVGGVEREVENGVARFDVPVTGQPGSSTSWSVEYLGTETWATSSSTFATRVDPAEVTLTATSPPQSSQGEPVQLQVSVSTSADGATTVPPSGDVTIRESGSTTGIAADLRPCGSCSTRSGIVTLAAPSPGRHTYVVSYADPSGRTAAADTVDVAVDVVARKAVTLDPATNSTVTTGGVTFLRPVVRSDAGSVLGGTVTLYDGTTEVAAGPVGQSLQVAPSWIGERTLSLRYSGDRSHLPVTIDRYVTITVIRKVTSVAPGTTFYTVRAGEPVAVPVAVSERLGGGVVSVGSVEVRDGQRVLASTTAGPDASLVFTPDWVGRRPLTIAYLGDTTRDSSTSSVTVEVTPPTVGPTLAAVLPARIQRGRTQVVTVTGTGFTDATRLVAPVTGVRVGRPEVLSSRQMRVSVTVGSLAGLGARSWTLTEAGETIGCATARACDLVVLSSPEVTDVGPSVLRRGATTSVTLTGSGFVDGMRVALTGSGIRVVRVDVGSARRAVLKVTTSAGAALTARTLRLTNPDGGQTQVDDALRLRR